ncbi:MAG: DEAD/DEAH box helicase family protein [Desulfurococcales archaeon]|nr:DEAD/DEAH box helicase family protein [Desulfurococcales archaeon]
MKKRRLRPRDYQIEAYRWALEKKRAVVCMPTGTGKTLVAALWIEELLSSRKAKKILVLEPTRFMVEQTSRFLTMYGLEVRPLHGSLPESLKRKALDARIIVATPEILLGEYGRVLDCIDAVVVDESHHTTGQDAYLKVMEKIHASYRLGLSAFIPRSRHGLIRKYIGEIRCWSWSDPRIRRYVPDWYGEVYEAPFNDEERKLYNLLESLWEKSHGSLRVLIGNALRWYSRDGALALWETYRKPGSRLRRILREYEPLLTSHHIRPLHKLDALKRVLSDYEGEYTKAIIFVERVAIALYLYRVLHNYRPVLIIGRRRIEPRKAIEQARRPETRIIIATSAGEEGIDLPEADLLVIWSNIASPLRFIQRLGRILRPKKGVKKTKYAVFIATPDTVDTDSLIDGLLLAEKAGVKLGVEPETMRYLLNLSRRRRILDLISENPLPADIIARALEAPLERIQRSLAWLLRHGLAAYIYTGIGRIYFTSDSVEKLLREYREYLNPDPSLYASITFYPETGKPVTYRGTYMQVRRRAVKIICRHSISRVRASIQLIIRRGFVRLVNLTYSFPVADEVLLDIVLRNIYSAGRIVV